MPRERTTGATALADILADARVFRLKDASASHRLSSTRPVWSTGRRALDARLPDGGWPTASLIEVLLDAADLGLGAAEFGRDAATLGRGTAGLGPGAAALGPGAAGLGPGAAGLGEVQLFLPALVECQRKRDGDSPWVVWIAPPHEPFAPALAQQGIELSRLIVVRPPSATEALWAAEQALGSGVCAAVLLWLKGTDDRWLRRLKLAAEAGGALGVLFRPERHRFESSPASLRLLLTRGDREPRLEIIKVQGGRPGPIEPERVSIDGPALIAT
jgi:cell division inhibitor SulA